MFAYGGSDSFAGIGGNDIIYGGGLFDTLWGGEGNDTLWGGIDGDTLLGDAGTDTLIGGAGNDSIDGGTGIDRAVIAGNVADFELRRVGDLVILRDLAATDAGDEGTDSLTGVEQLQFADRIVTLSANPPTASTDVDATDNKVASGATTGTTVGLTALSTDPDLDPVTYSLVDDAGGRFTIDALSGVVTVADGSLLDATLASEHTITVRALTGDGFFADSAFIIAVQDPTSPPPPPPPPPPSGATEDSDTLTGTAGADTIDALGGDDLVQGLEDSDTLYGGEGRDTLDGGEGNDLLGGGNGDDTMEGGAADDRLDGGDGADRLAGGAGNDRLFGGDADDSLAGGNGVDTLFGGDGFDLADYRSIDAAVTIFLGSGAVEVEGVDGAGRLGRDIEHILTGNGDDVVFADFAGITVDAGAGNDFVLGELGDDELAGGEGDDNLFGGEAGNNTLRGEAGNDTMSGGDEDDWLVAGAGRDSLYGGEGFDTADLRGVAGAAAVDQRNGQVSLAGVVGFGELAADIEQILTGAGGDTVHGRADGIVADLGEGGDTAVGAGGADTLLGAGGNDTLDGGNGADLLLGGNGDDSLTGRFGADSLFGGNGFDTADFRFTVSATVINLAGGTAAVQPGSFVQTLGADIERLLTGNGADSVTGNDAGNLLDAGAGNDRANGAGGADTLLGGLGDDSLAGADGNDSLGGGGGLDRLAGGNGLDSLAGGDAVDTLWGDSGNDSLSGGNGNDTLTGGTGTDRMAGEANADRFVFDDGHAGIGATVRDLVLDFSGTGGDRIDLSPIDALLASAGTDQAFAWRGTQAFSASGQVRYLVSSGNVVIQGSNDASTDVDFEIQVNGITTFQAGWLIL